MSPTPEELREISAAAYRGRYRELYDQLAEGVSDCVTLLGEEMRRPGYLRGWRWRIGCRLLAELELRLPPTVENEREYLWALYRTRRFLTRGRGSHPNPR